MKIIGGVVLLILACVLFADLGSHPASANAAAPDVVAAKPAQGWEYSQSTDAMTGETMRWACLSSENSAQFGFPYDERDDKAQLCVRTKNGRTVSYLSIDKGQFLCDIVDGCTVASRFEEGPIQRLSATDTNDGRSDLIFIQNPQALMPRLPKASTLRLQARFYREGDVTFTFHPQGFDEKKLALPVGR